MVGGKYFLQREGDTASSTYKENVEVIAEVAAQHPVTAGGGSLRMEDELYKGMWISLDVKVLLTTSSPISDKAIAWVSPYPRSRVVYVQSGHGPGAHRYPGYRKLVHNALLWTAGRLN